MQFEAEYYDGISPHAQRVWATVKDSRILGCVRNALDNLEIDPDNHACNDTFFNDTFNDAFDHAVAECHVQAKLGSGKRLIDLPDGCRLETDFQDLEQLLPAQTSLGFWRVVHYAETHLIVIVLALIGAIAISFAMLQYGVPVAAKFAALATPESLEKDLGKQTLDLLDHEKLGYFKASHLAMDKQTRIQNALIAMCKKTQTCPVYVLNFRSSCQAATWSLLMS
jgi:uncharacterized membrane protein (Fun14 family)